MRVRRLVVGAVLCTAVTRAAQGQERGILSALPPRSELRLLLLDSTMVSGRILLLRDQRAVLRMVLRPTVTNAHFEDRPVVLDSIAHAWTRSGSYWKTGAMIGMAAGTLSLYVTMHALADELDCGPVEWKCAAFSLAGGGVPGAILGMLIGGGVVRWRLLF